MQHRPDENTYIGEHKPCGHRSPRHYRVRGAFDTPSEPMAAVKNRTATPFESLCKYHAEAFSFSTRLRIRAAFSQEKETVKHLADGPYPELSERKPKTFISTTLHPLRHLKGLSLFKGTQTHIVRIIRLRAQTLRSRQYRAIFRIPDRRRKKFAFSEFSPHSIFNGRKRERPERGNSGAPTRDKLSPTSLAPFICAGQCASPHRWTREDSHSLQPR